ncbi:MAG: hypothetical protein ABSA52_09500 [Candidatus Binatia bacterium]|jgi:hypothetical protein
MTARKNNAPYFEFFRKRIDFIRAHCVEADVIEGYILWGACVDALAQIHAACNASAAKQRNREQFVTFLLSFAPGHHLDRISVPLLAYDLQQLSKKQGDVFSKAQALERHAALASYAKAAAEKRLWRCDEDKEWTPKLMSLAMCDACNRNLWSVVEKNRYANLLYLQYRNCAVHGLYLGMKTSTAGLPSSPPPWYMNHRVAVDDPSKKTTQGKQTKNPKKHRARTRIQFPIWYLVDLLGELTGELERRCAANAWTIPPNPTVKHC